MRPDDSLLLLLFLLRLRLRHLRRSKSTLICNPAVIGSSYKCSAYLSIHNPNGNFRIYQIGSWQHLPSTGRLAPSFRFSLRCRGVASADGCVTSAPSIGQCKWNRRPSIGRFEHHVFLLKMIAIIYYPCVYLSGVEVAHRLPNPPTYPPTPSPPPFPSHPPHYSSHRSNGAGTCRNIPKGGQNKCGGWEGGGEKA